MLFYPAAGMNRKLAPFSFLLMSYSFFLILVLILLYNIATIVQDDTLNHSAKKVSSVYDMMFQFKNIE